MAEFDFELFYGASPLGEGLCSLDFRPELFEAALAHSDTLPEWWSLMQIFLVGC